MIEYQPNKFQYKMLEIFDDKDISQAVFGGVINAGKTYGISALIIIKCLEFPGIRVGLGRSTVTLLKKSTVTSILEVLSDWKLEPDKDYKYSEQKGEISFSNGSVIVFLDLEYYSTDPEYKRLLGLLLTFAVIDEAGELKSEKPFSILFSRCGRWKNKKYNIGAKIYATCNPTTNFIRDEFYIPYIKEQLPEYRAFITTTIKDNPLVDEQYYDNLYKTLSTADIKRFLEGDWFYDNNPDKIIDSRKIQDLYTNNFITPDGKKYLSIDVSLMGKDNTVIILWDGLVVDKIYKYDKNEADFLISKINELKQQYSIPNSHIVFDADGIGAYINGFIKGAVGINNGGKCLNNENYSNLKSQLYFYLAKYINENKIYIKDENYKNELTRELEVVEKEDNTTKLSIISKDKVKRLLGNSPDFSDALAYRLYYELNKVAPKINIIKPVRSGYRQYNRI